MNKETILDKIKATAKKNGGKPLGQERFARETGIQISHWQKYWIRWSQVLGEAGFEPNEYQSAYSEEYIFEKLAILTRELQHFPVNAEIKMKGREDKAFPSHNVFSRIGQKKVLARKLYEYVISREQFKDISEIVNTENNKFQNEDEEQVAVENNPKGYVYLVKHGNRSEYKIGRTNNPIRREGELSIELPEKLSPIHYIETDDPSGIEKYWHSRFSAKRKNGEWFNLSAEDVQAFKRWKKIF